MFGGIKPESQALLGLLLSSSLFLTRNDPAPPALPRWLKIALLFVFLIPLLPLPLPLAQWLSPERARLAVAFPIAGKVSTWITFSTSPARTISRLWELALAASAFILVRRASVYPGANRRLALTLAVALALLAGSDLWSREHRRDTVLGLWSISWGKGAGTFANRNHFANWIFLASFFCVGWALRALFVRKYLGLVLFVLGASGFGLVMAFLSASRGGAFAFLAGALILVFSLRRRFESRSFALSVSFALTAAVVIGLISAEPLIKRLQTEGASLSYKSELWRQALGVAARFPVMGVGPGAFVRVFDHYKTAHGDGTFWHVENDPIELLVEIGIPGTLLVLILLLRLVRFRNNSPLAAGTLAALVVFALHSLVEFVSYMPANLILAASLLGAGSSKGNETAVASGRARGLLSIAMWIVATLQLAAWFDYWQASRSSSESVALARIERSLAFWPLAADRRVGELRAAAKRGVNAEEALRLDLKIDRALRLDPLNWNLRLEQTWFEFAFTTNRTKGLSNAWITVRLNPLQGQIPLRFARRFAASYPDVALQFLAAVHPGVSQNHRDALGLAWEITHDPVQLWTLTPNTVPSILNLVHFAQQEKLFGVAAEACQALEGRIDVERLAQLFLDAQRPAQTLRLLANSNTLRAQKLRLQSLDQLGRFDEATAAAQKLFSEPAFKMTLRDRIKVDAGFDQLFEKQKANPKDPAAALLLAEKIVLLNPVDLKLLGSLAYQFPDEPRISYLLFQAQLNDSKAASATAAALANRLIP